MKYLIIITLALLMTFCSSPQNIKNENTGEYIISTDDEKYLMEAYSAGLFEIKAAEIAIDKANNSEIKEYANNLASINQKTNNEISQIAFARKIKLPLELNQFQEVKINALKERLPAEFDKEYINQMESNQKWTVDLFEKVSTESEDDEITTWAIHTLPTIKENLEKSTLIKKKILNQ